MRRHGVGVGSHQNRQFAFLRIESQSSGGQIGAAGARDSFRHQHCLPACAAQCAWHSGASFRSILEPVLKVAPTTMPSPARVWRGSYASYRRTALSLSVYSTIAVFPFLPSALPTTKIPCDWPVLPAGPWSSWKIERHQVSHTLVGAILAHTWQLPDLVCDAIRDHHRFEMLYGAPRRARAMLPH